MDQMEYVYVLSVESNRAPIAVIRDRGKAKEVARSWEQRYGEKVDIIPINLS